MAKLIAACLFFWAAAAQAACGSGEPEIYDTASKRRVSMSEMLQVLRQSDIVLLGEKHDDPCHHDYETALLLAVEKQQALGSVLLEMIDSSQQRDVAEVQQWLRNGGKTTLNRLPEKMSWNQAWDWQAYGPLIWNVIGKSAPLLAANPPRRDVLKMKDFRPAGAHAARAEVKEALGKIMAGNHGSTEGMVAMQQYKDSVMAQNLLAAPKPAWLIAGAVHTAKDLGVPLFLQDAAYSGSLKVVIFTNKNSGLDHRHADYLFYFPPRHSSGDTATH